MSTLSPTSLTSDEQRLILRATARHIRDHTIISLPLDAGLPRAGTVGSAFGNSKPGPG